ncbi:MAG: hypothetical protein DF168_01194 [Candidatus Moanabacter tarae]|uniref:Uncharacterized protein n=1 Tax=Candidatus Moanibacter tarae TaxID=2200854 RepID=A0A2Z4AEU1_9BACT|nr:MAG: hypothetical protein DF168_01194 [Candidatus Moanabacter tarae]
MGQVSHPINSKSLIALEVIFILILNLEMSEVGQYGNGSLVPNGEISNERDCLDASNDLTKRDSPNLYLA